MTRNDVLQWFILGLGLSAPDGDLGHPTTVSQLLQDANKRRFDCDRDEVLDALYTLPREDAALIKFVSTGEESHHVSFERVRNTAGWPDYFTTGPFNIKVLAEGRLHYKKLSQQLEGTQWSNLSS